MRHLALLRATFEEAGFDAVRTYIPSGREGVDKRVQVDDHPQLVDLFD